MGVHKRISTGSELLDTLLEGGYECDAVTTIYGPAGSGKTNLSLLAAINVAKQGKKVIYIDTEGGFSVERLKQLTQDHEKVLDQIIFFTPTSFTEQHKVIDGLKKMLKGVGLIVVDTITMLYRLERSMGGDAVKEFNRDLGLQLRVLNEICRRQQIPVLLNNQVYSSFDNPLRQEVKMVGGEMLKYASKCLLELKSLSAGKRKITLRKHRSVAGEKEAFFEIVQEGIAPFEQYYSEQLKK